MLYYTDEIETPLIYFLDLGLLPLNVKIYQFRQQEFQFQPYSVRPAQSVVILFSGLLEGY